MKALVLALCAFCAANAFAANPITIDPNAKLQPALVKSFDARGNDARLRVIVSLEASQPRGLSKAQAIAEAQGRVLGAFKSENNGQGLAVLARYQTLFGFSAELTRGQVNALARRGDVSYVEEMPVHEKLYPESHPLTDVDLAQGNYDGNGSVIAIIDDGIDAAHPAFAGKLIDGYDFADFDSDPTIDCLDQSHGTAVAGVALGNSTGVKGVAPGADMVFLKIQSAGICGSSSLDGDIVGAIDWATANQEAYGIDIISMSLGGGLYSSESSCDASSAIYRNAIQNAVNAGITVIAASGNDGMCDSMSRPACFSDAISVGATYDANIGNVGWCVNRNTCADASPNPGCPIGYVAAFENAIADNVIVYSNSASFLDVTAPATCAQSAAPGDDITDCFGGTSSATPFTSGAAALAVQAAGKGVLTPADMRDVLAVSGDLVTDPKNGRVTPRINGLGVVTEAATYGGGEPPVNNPPTAAFTDSCDFLDCSFSDASTDSDGSVVAWNWDFGDGGTSTATNPSHAYAAGGTYTVSLTVRDDDGDSDTVSLDVTVTAPDPGTIEVDLVGTSSTSRNKWTATVEDRNNNQLDGTWSESGTASCSGNVCTLSGLHVRKVSSVVFTETITGNGESIEVTRP
jgi:subtilisin family serine protease